MRARGADMRQMRGIASVFGPILCLVAIGVGVYVVAATGGFATDTPGCVDGYWCPTGLERVLIGVGLGIFGLGGAGLFAATGVGLFRYAWGGAPAQPRWIVKTAAAAPIVTFAWFMAMMFCWGKIGAFS
jgi:hypothetical protein